MTESSILPKQVGQVRMVQRLRVALGPAHRVPRALVGQTDDSLGHTACAMDRVVTDAGPRPLHVLQQLNEALWPIPGYPQDQSLCRSEFSVVPGPKIAYNPHAEVMGTREAGKAR